MTRVPRTALARRVALSILVFWLMALAFVGGNVSGYSVHSALAAEERPAEFAIFWEAWDYVVGHFVDRERIDFTAMTYGAIEGMLASLGDEGHTTFLPPDAVKLHQSSLQGSFEGIGAYVSMEDGNVMNRRPHQWLARGIGGRSGRRCDCGGGWRLGRKESHWMR